MKKYCWKCQKISTFEKSNLEYVAKRTGGVNWLCKKCVEKWKKENNIKEVVRIETPGSLFSCKYEYIYNK